jgi:hypothetical protein
MRASAANPRSPICILGAGPAALLSQAFLRKKGVKPMVVGESVLGNLSPMRHEGARVGLVPIFPIQESDLFQRIAAEAPAAPEPVAITFAQGAEELTDAITPGSHAEFLAQSFGDRQQRLILAKKHVGCEAFTRPFPELRRKVVASYPQVKRTRTLVGFAEGVSAYLHYIERAQFSVSVPERIVKVDLAKRCIVTASSEIRYDQLVCTLPIPDLVRLAGIAPRVAFVGSGVQTAVAAVEEPLSANRVVYDCAARSPIFRAFVPRPGFIVAQVARGEWDAASGAIATRIAELFGLAAAPRILRRFTIDNCYPLAVSDEARRDELFHQLERSGTVLFGRAAQWRYLDLDELDWERIDGLQ